MDFKIMSCPVCGAPLHVGNDEEYIICDACDTPLRLNKEYRLFRMDDAEAFGYHFEKGRERAQLEREHRRQSEEYGSYYSSDYRSQPGRRMPPYQAPPTNAWDNRAYIDPMVSDKDRWTALVICIFLGMYGGHYFYLGNIKKGLLYFFTLGFFCFGWIIDIISIAMGNFKDQYGRVLVSTKERYSLNK